MGQNTRRDICENIVNPLVLCPSVTSSVSGVFDLQLTGAQVNYTISPVTISPQETSLQSISSFVLPQGVFMPVWFCVDEYYMVSLNPDEAKIDETHWHMRTYFISTLSIAIQPYAKKVVFLL